MITISVSMLALILSTLGFVFTLYCWRTERSPSVIAYLEGGISPYLVIENTGHTPAYEVILEKNGDILNSSNVSIFYDNLIAHKRSFLAPQSKVKCAVRPLGPKDNSSQECEVTIKWKTRRSKFSVFNRRRQIPIHAKDTTTIWSWT